MLIAMDDPCDPIPLPPPEGSGDNAVFVTPLMIASYLGDYKAVDFIIRHSREKWMSAVLAKSRPGGDDCAALAKEARDLAQMLLGEAQELLGDATISQEERDAKEKIIQERTDNLEMAEKLVTRLDDMKQHALEKRRKQTIHFTLLALAGVVLCVPCFYCLKFLWANVILFRCLRFVWTAFKYLIILVACVMFPVALLLIAFSYIWYYLFHGLAPQEPKKDMQQSASEPGNGGSTDFFCLDGEACAAKGETCTIRIEDPFSGELFVAAPVRVGEEELQVCSRLIS